MVDFNLTNEAINEIINSIFIRMDLMDEIISNVIKFLSFLALIISVACVYFSIKNPLSKISNALNKSLLTIIVLVISISIISLTPRFKYVKEVVDVETVYSNVKVYLDDEQFKYFGLLITQDENQRIASKSGITPIILYGTLHKVKDKYSKN